MAKYQINYEANDYDENKEKGIPYKDFLEWSETIVFAFFIVMLVFTFIFRTASIKGEGMQPAFKNGDKLIVNSINYTPQAGDVVVVDNAAMGAPTVKRIAAMGGDTVVIDNSTGKITVNGTELQYGFVPEEYVEFSEKVTVTVPQGSLFVLSDNRADRNDSRNEAVGCVPEDNVAGEVVFRFWPLNGIGAVK